MKKTNWRSYITFFALWQKYGYYISSNLLTTTCWRAFINILERNSEKSHNEYLELKYIIWISN